MGFVSLNYGKSFQENKNSKKKIFDKNDHQKTTKLFRRCVAMSRPSGELFHCEKASRKNGASITNKIFFSTRMISKRRRNCSEDCGTGADRESRRRHAAPHVEGRARVRPGTRRCTPSRRTQIVELGRATYHHPATLEHASLGGVGTPSQRTGASQASQAASRRPS